MFHRKKAKNQVLNVTSPDSQKERNPNPTEEKDGSFRKKSVKNSKAFRYSVFGVITLVSLYLILMPFIPLIPYYFRELTGKNVYLPQETDGSSESGLTSERREDLENEIPEVNTLEIPTVGIKVPISEGSNDSALDRGAWHRPGTGTPVVGGNMVVTGHRFKYLPPSNLTFYHLDKVVVGDGVVVYWDGKRYDYLVKKIFVVTPDRIEVEASTAEHQLTLYTCTPLWTAKERLVIIAEPSFSRVGRE